MDKSGVRYWLKEMQGVISGCLCYTTDINYSLPTLLSAAQARANLSSRFDVVVVLVDAPRREIADLRQAHEAEGITLTEVSGDAIDNLRIDFARCFLDRLLDPQYRRVVHIDGDTHILGSLDPLLDHDVAAGRVLAVPDPLALLASTSSYTWHFQRKRLAEIGLTPDAARRYANTGLFSARREDLAGIGEACRTLALKRGSRMRFGQQDAFNVVLGSAIDLASFRWNYPAFFSNFCFDHLVEPRVRHFMSNPRPWQGAFLPWGPEGQTPYLDLLRRYPALAHLHSPLSSPRRLRYEIQQQVKRVVEPMFWDTSHLRGRIAEHEVAAII
ncbi:MAG: hypothetical protein INR71_04490 [Terriglobus roseus]|nr:hypothetical protein [Terriglobus roseus]